MGLILLWSLLAVTEGATISSEIFVNSISVGANIINTGDYLFRYNRQFGGSSIIPAPIYLRAKDDGTPYVAWSDGTTIHVSILNCVGSAVEDEMTVAGEEVRGLVVHEDDSVALLVRRSAGGSCSCSPPSCPGTCGTLHHVKLNPSGGVVWDRTVDHRITDFSLGNAVLEASDNHDTPEYGLYYKVSSTNTMCGGLEPGHQGDTMKFWDVSTGPDASYVESACPSSPGFSWGCSHSMELKFVWNKYLKSFGAVCLTDAYPSPTGYYWWNSKNIMETDGYGNGYTDGGLGDLVATPTGFALTLTAPKTAGTYGSQCTDVAFLTLDASGNVLSTVWLTSGTDCYEFSHLAEFGSDDGFLVGWKNTATNAFYLAELDAAGGIVRSSEDVSSLTTWPERESWITYNNGDVGWAAVWNDGLSPTYRSSTAGGDQLRMVRVAPGGPCTDCDYDGNGPGGQGCGYGECVDGTPNDRAFTCDCSGVPYSGDNCETVVGDCTVNTNGPNSRNCGTGQCIDAIIDDNAFTCDCDSVPYTGSNCHIPTLDCDDPTNGPGGAGCGTGTCVDGIPVDDDFTCNCAGVPFSGFNCEIATSTNCAEAGVRVAGCVQRDGYNGDWSRAWGEDVNGKAHYIRGGNHLYFAPSRWYFDTDTSTSGYIGYVYSSDDFPTEATNTPSIWPGGSSSFIAEDAMTIECIPYTDPCPALFGAQDASGVFLLNEWPETVQGASATIGCPSGYSGSVTRDCGSDGAWAAPVGDCTPSITSCSSPSSFALATGLAACSGTDEGGTCSFGCSGGATPTGTLTCSGGLWLGSPSCAGGTSGCTREAPTTGEVNACSADSVESDTCVWTCAAGFLGTSTTRTCGAGGSWSGTTISCSEAPPCMPGDACTHSNPCWDAAGQCDSTGVCMAPAMADGSACALAGGGSGTCTSGVCGAAASSGGGSSGGGSGAPAEVVVEDAEEEGGGSAGAIAGGVIGAVLCCALVGAVAAIAIMKKSGKPAENKGADPYEQNNVALSSPAAEAPAAAAAASRPSRAPPSRPGPPPPPPGGATKGELATALYDYEDPNHAISFSAGDHVTILEKLDDGWARGSANGSEGHFPISYVKVVPAHPAPPSRSLPPPPPKPTAHERAAPPPPRNKPVPPKPAAHERAAPPPPRNKPVPPKPAGRGAGGRGRGPPPRGRGRGGRGPPPPPRH